MSEAAYKETAEARPGDRKLILGYDAGCGTCAETARLVEERVGDKLSVADLRDPDLLSMRAEALGEDARWAPTLFELENGQLVGAWTGWRMGWALSRKLGPAATWRVMQALGEAGAAPPPELPTTEVTGGMDRGTFLRGAAGTVVAASVLLGTPGWLQNAASAATPYRFHKGTAAQRKSAQSIVRRSAQFNRLADMQRKVNASFSFSRASYGFRKDLGILTVYSAGRQRGINAIFFLDMRRKGVFMYNHQVFLPNSRTENLLRADVLSYTSGQAAGKYRHVLLELKLKDRDGDQRSGATSSAKDIYAGDVITDDGRRRTMERFIEDVEAETNRRGRTAQSRIVFGPSACSNCRARAELYCQNVLEVGCTVVGAGAGCAVGAIATAWGGPAMGVGCLIGGGVTATLTGLGCSIYLNNVSASGAGCAGYAASARGGCLGVCSGGSGGSDGSGLCDP